MGRNKGTNDYSNNFEPQVTGLLDARTRVDTKADLLLASTWASTDGNVYLPKGIRVSITDDTTADNNGVYMLMADDYTVASNWMKIGASGGDEPIYLTTPALLDATADIPLNASDIVQLRRLFDKNDTIPNVKYIGVDEGGTTYSHVEMNVSFTTIDEPIIAMFIHPFGGDGMVMQLFVNTGTASAPMAMGYMDSGGGSGSSNVKVLTTTDLINPSRTANITLNAADVQTIKTFTNNDILVSASTPAGAANTQTISIPLTMNKIATGTMGVIMFSWVYGGTIYNMILNISNGVITAQKPQAVTGSGGSAEAAYITTLALENIISGDTLTQLDYDELVTIFNKWKAGIPVILDYENYTGILKIGSISNTVEDSYLSLYTAEGYTLREWKVRVTVGEQWEVTSRRLGMEIDLFDLTNVGSFTGASGSVIWDSMQQIEKAKILWAHIYCNSFFGENGTFPISINYAENFFYVFYNNQKYKIEYSYPDASTCNITVTDVTPYNLNLEVRITDNQIQCRVNQIVENGYICFYRKKRCGCSNNARPKRNKYTIPAFYFRLNKKVEGLGISVIPISTMQPNVWKTIPISPTSLASQDSTSIRFKGNVHAKPCELTSTTGTALNKKTAVLNLGLAYNVINPNYINGYKENNAIPNDIVRAGNMVKFKARLNCLDVTNINSGYQIIYTMD